MDSERLIATLNDYVIVAFRIVIAIRNSINCAALLHTHRNKQNLPLLTWLTIFDLWESCLHDTTQKIKPMLIPHMTPFKITHTLLFRCIKMNMCPWSTKAVISNTGIFVAIDNNTLYGSKLSIFLLWQKSLGY